MTYVFGEYALDTRLYSYAGRDSPARSSQKCSTCSST
jgi:hypothetical protein